ncbi:MAG: hypothetical protein ACYTF0_05825 [Planctomycetota bacterium]|jgi:hypothetical protein
MKYLLLVVSLLALAGCAGSRDPMATVSPYDFRHLRDYAFTFDVEQPQAEWSPRGNLIVGRGVKGVALHIEDVGVQTYTTADGFSPWEPQWLPDASVVFGPQAVPVFDDEGRVVTPAQGLHRAPFLGEALGKPRELTASGYRPRRWNDRLVASLNDTILTFAKDGSNEEVFGEGFFPEPQAAGPGICWQTTPILHDDYWTGIDGVGELVVRWRPGEVSLLKGGVAARWSADGGVCAVRLAAKAAAGEPWWSAGSAVVYLSEPGAVASVLMFDAHEIEPHPFAPVAAVVSNDGRVHLVDLRNGDARVIAEDGARPRWNHDGTRLLLQEAHAEADRSQIRVSLFKVGA